MKNFKRLTNLFLAAVLLVASISVFVLPKAYATNGILDHRYIRMSSSAAATDNIQYSVGFNYGTAGQTLAGIVIEFCDLSPIPGDSCSIPTGFNANVNSGDNYGTGLLTAQTGVTGWTIDTTNSSNRKIVLTRSATTGTGAQTLTFGDGSTTGLKNPSATNTSFYARIFTYATAAGAQNYTSTDPTNGGATAPTDEGGVAITTTAQLSITAKIEEQITLCLHTNASCGLGGNAISLGNSGILSSSHTYSSVDAKLDASTNAANGMIIYAQGTTLTSPQSFTIAAIGCPSACGGGTGSSPAAPYSSSVGTEQFGFCLAGSGGSVTATAPYNDANCSSVTDGEDHVGTAKFAFDTTSTNNMTTLGGMQIASSSGPSLTTTLTLGYMVNIAATSRSGVYTTTQTFIGVGTF